jgi:hypothetical protein
MLVHEILRKAADLIDYHGWTQGVFGWGNIDGSEDHSDTFCIEGAILAAMGVEFVERDSECPAFNAVRTYLGLHPEDVLYQWNDDLDIEEGQEVVIQTLLGAANLAEWFDELAKEVVEA